MQHLAYEVVDVFTDRAFAGNPLAVVLDADDLSTEQLQSIAREFNLSETSFPMKADVDGADYRLRIFTPMQELPFAGHPSVGAADVMLRQGRVSAGRVVQSCGAGLLPLEVAADVVTLTGGTPTWGDATDADALLGAVGLDRDDLDGVPRRAGCGIDWTFLPVRREALARAEADPRAVSAIGGTGVSVIAWDGTTAHARVFAAGAGVPEDPATGSAGVALGAYLVVSGLVGADGETAYDVVQGVEMGRPSLLRCAVVARDGKPVETRVSGSTVPVARGEIRIPG
ncbi:MAG: trans-2,3-dihydro-3-hydroxyanthranilate isomerase [Actinomycetota bacterium]|nr:trans-2,3-dihydro-3-hydroxyanthranilate isomerase [Actinomycetota bacterium]